MIRLRLRITSTYKIQVMECILFYNDVLLNETNEYDKEVMKWKEMDVWWNEEDFKTTIELTDFI